ncbi:hypothetical protein BC827DRAFT_602966 [Russula dissimulans]|nr:hypothetical protein BC827DRAFT_602966 [Russula dissimulans]
MHPAKLGICGINVSRLQDGGCPRHGNCPHRVRLCPSRLQPIPRHHSWTDPVVLRFGKLCPLRSRSAPPRANDIDFFFYKKGLWYRYAKSCPIINKYQPHAAHSGIARTSCTSPPGENRTVRNENPSPLCGFPSLEFPHPPGVIVVPRPAGA